MPNLTYIAHYGQRIHAGHFYVPNVAPVWGSVPTLNVTQGQVVSTSIAVYCTDADGDPVTFAIVAGALPAGLSMSLSGVITGTTSVLTNQYNITVRASDDHGHIADKVVIVSVAAPSNVAPVWALVPTIAVTQGAAVSVDMNTYCTDADDDTLTYTVVSGTLPSGMTLSTAGVLSGNTSDAPASVGVTVRADDGHGHVVDKGITLSISSSSLWAYTIPDVAFPPGVPAVYSFADKINSPQRIFVSLDPSYTLPVGITLDNLGHRLIYDGVGSSFAASVKLWADDNANSSTGYGVNWGLVGDGTGATHLRVVKMDNASADFLSWDHNGGDWEDANGIYQGSTPFATTLVPLAGSEILVTWNVTSLVQMWDNTANKLCAMFLRRVSGDNVRFRSSEYLADPTHRPSLHVVYEDGSTADLAPISDTSLDLSTDSAPGSNDWLWIAGGSNAALEWKRADVLAKRVISAELRMWSYYQYAASNIQVMQLRIPVNHTLPAVEYGLASSFVGDAGIAAHPQVIAAQMWTSNTWDTDDNWYNHAGSPMVTRVAIPELPSGSGVRVTVFYVPPENRIPQGSAGGHAFTKYLPPKGTPDPRDEGYDEVFFRYYVRLHNYVNGVTLGGKMPGISGVTELDKDVLPSYGNIAYHLYTTTTSYNGNTFPAGAFDTGLANGGSGTGYGTRGWSARGGYDIPLADGTPLAKRIFQHTYFYNALTAVYGDELTWTKDKRDIAAFEEDRFYCIEQQVKVNTALPGQAALSDGIHRIWIDGMLVFEKLDCKFRSDYDHVVDASHPDGRNWKTAMGITKIWFDHTHGGQGYNNETYWTDMGHCVIATAYIGPMGT